MFDCVSTLPHTDQESFSCCVCSFEFVFLLSQGVNGLMCRPEILARKTVNLFTKRQHQVIICTCASGGKGGGPGFQGP